MNNENYDIIFRGEIIAGHTIADVKLRLMSLFKTDSQKIEAIFSGKPITLKRNLDQASANKYLAVLTKAGAQIELTQPNLSTEPATKTNNTEALREARLAEQAKRRAERTQSTAAQPPSMSERLAQEASKSAAPQTDANTIKTSTTAFDLAPAGSDVLKPNERTVTSPANIDTSNISLRAEGGELLDNNEKRAFIELDIDLSEYDLAQLGDSLIKEDERTPVTPTTFIDSKLTLDEVGADMIRANEKAAPTTTNIDTSSIKLSPAGSDMGQIAKSEAPPPPDTSKITLAP